MGIFLGALEQLHGSFSDISSHLEFERPELVMPELLLKELWLYTLAIWELLRLITEKD